MEESLNYFRIQHQCYQKLIMQPKKNKVKTGCGTTPGNLVVTDISE